MNSFKSTKLPKYFELKVFRFVEINCHDEIIYFEPQNEYYFVIHVMISQNTEVHTVSILLYNGLHQLFILHC